MTWSAEPGRRDERARHFAHYGRGSKSASAPRQPRKLQLSCPSHVRSCRVEDGCARPVLPVWYQAVDSSMRQGGGVALESVELARFIEHIRGDRRVELPPWPGGWPHEIEAALLEAVFSIRAKYGRPVSGATVATGIRAVVHRWQQHRHGRADDLQPLAACDPLLLADIVDNHSKASRRLKAGIVVDAAGRLVRDTGLRHAAEFTGSDHQRLVYLAAPGCGPVTWSYLGMLVAMASMINRSAPWPETTFPLRRRAPALIGAQVGEDRTGPRFGALIS